MAHIPNTSLFITPLGEGVLDKEQESLGLTWRVLHMGDCEVSHLLHIAFLDCITPSQFFQQAAYETNGTQVAGGILLKCTHPKSWSVPYIIKDVVVGIPKQRTISAASMFKIMMRDKALFAQEGVVIDGG